MKAAWAQTKRFYALRNLPFVFNQSDFQFALCCAWRAAKAERMNPVERRVFAIKEEIDALSYKSLRIDITTKCQSLEAQLRNLAA